MKKLLVLLLCLVTAVSAVGCGKDKGKAEEKKPSSTQVQTEEKAVEKADNDEKSENTGNIEETDGDEAEVTEIPLESAEELSEIVDEFNNTDDPEVKEELRKKLEEIFAQAEAAAAK